eukprot:TRINITY_DN19754_c0_g1_i1.p1 TRINITY_DN19754_c0_g1~~TRINITY_DN19754_c0_g1_i1.p1  ORF type:complete len:792 (+),score=179.63 TRINITY_DN19754_c0_g1_i1:131-2506(+)
MSLGSASVQGSLKLPASPSGKLNLGARPRLPTDGSVASGFAPPARGRLASEQTGGASSSQKREDVRNARRLASDIPQLLKQLQKDPRGTAMAFWEALKQLSLQTYGNSTTAFENFSDPKDGLMSFEQFQDLCLELGLGAKTKVLRMLFDTRLDPGALAWSLRNFQDVLLVKSIDRIRGKMKYYNDGVHRMNSHLDRFIRHLALHSGEANKQQAVLRFHRKLTVVFAYELFADLRKAQRRAGFNLPLTCAFFIQMVGTVWNKSCFQHYELDFLKNIYHRVDRERVNNVDIKDLAVAMALLDAESSRFEKAKFIFHVFDDDEDGCLTKEQILRMYCCAAIHAAIARRDHEAYDADILFKDELSLSKARRLFEYTTSRLDAVTNYRNEEMFYTFPELWNIIETSPHLQEELIPACNSVAWVLSPPPHVAMPAASPSPSTPTSPMSPMSPTSPTSVKSGPFGRRRLGVSVIGNTSKVADGRTQSEADSTPTAGISAPPQALAVALSAAVAATRLRGGVRRRGPMQRRTHFGGLSKADEKDNVEMFRKAAAIRVRHALRGEWDEVGALQEVAADEDDPDSIAEAFAALRRSESLPALSGVGGQPWDAAMSSFDKRHGKSAAGSSWHDVHRSTLTDWARGDSKLKSEREREAANEAGQGKKLSSSQSMPNFPGAKRRREASQPGVRTTLPPISGKGEPLARVDCSPEEFALAVKKDIQKSKAKDRQTAAALVPGDKQRRNDAYAVQRLRQVSEVKANSKRQAVAASAAQEQEGHRENAEYDCLLCGGRHGMAAVCTT